MDSNSDEPQYDMFATEDEKYCEEVLLKPHIRSQSEYTVCSSAQATLSLGSASTSEEDDDVQSWPDPQTKRPPKLQWTLPSRFQKSIVHTFTGGQGAQEERMRVKHHTSMMALLHLVFSCCILQRLSYCLWWKLTDIITGAWTVLTRDLLPNLT